MVMDLWILQKICGTASKLVVCNKVLLNFLSFK